VHLFLVILILTKKYIHNIEFQTRCFLNIGKTRERFAIPMFIFAKIFFSTTKANTKPQYVVAKLLVAAPLLLALRPASLSILQRTRMCVVFANDFLIICWIYIPKINDHIQFQKFVMKEIFTIMNKQKI